MPHRPHHRQSLTLVQPPALSRIGRIHALETELAALKQQQRDALKAAITLDIGANIVFNAKDLFEHRLVSPVLASAFDEAGIRSPRQLGKRLKQLGLERVGEDRDGVLWQL